MPPIVIAAKAGDHSPGRNPANRAAAIVAFVTPGWMASLAFLLFALPLALFLALSTPTGGAPDETAHALQADAFASGQVLGRRDMVTLPSGERRIGAGFDVDPGFIGAAEVWHPTMTFTAADAARARGAQWRGAREFIQMGPLTAYLPVLYIPAALVTGIAKLAGIPPFEAFIGARLANVAAFTTIALTALMLARRGHALLFCLLALPMTVALAASLNPDGLLIAIAVLVVALATRITAPGADPQPLFSPSRIAMAVLIALVGVAKFPYVVLALLLLLPIHRFDRTLWHRFGLAVLVTLPGLLWVSYVMAKIAVPWPPMPPYAAGPLWPGEPGAVFHSPEAISQLSVIVANPMRIITITWNTIANDSWLYRSAVGILGFLTLILPARLYEIWAVSLLSALAAAALRGNRLWAARINVNDGLIVAVILATGIIAIYMSQYLTWTQVGAATALGPTGRYWLPLAPALVLALPEVSGPGLSKVRGALFGLSCIGAIAGLFEIPPLIAALYRG